MISHKREVGNEANPHRFDMIKKTPLTMSRDGLNSLKYDVSWYCKGTRKRVL